MGEKEFTHLTETGVHMVEVGTKPQQRRTAVASGKIHLQKETIEMIKHAEIIFRIKISYAESNRSSGECIDKSVCVRSTMQTAAKCDMLFTQNLPNFIAAVLIE